MIRKQLLRFVSLLVLLAWSQNLSSNTFSYSIDDGAWHADVSIFKCSMRHKVPFYGDAVFQRRAGELSEFKLSPITSRFKSGKASLRIKAPSWKHNSYEIDLGYVPVTQGMQPISMDTRGAERLISELLNGMELVMTREAFYGGRKSSQVKVQPIGFRKAYQDYQQCLADLLPVNYDQIKRSAVYFGSSKFEDITAGDQKKLDHMVMYAKADPKVTKFILDGHTDVVGMRKDNFDLSERRAKTVENYLLAKGLEKEKIVVRWHGERYPVAKNSTVMGRAKNRRVTIRIDRSE